MTRFVAFGFVVVALIALAASMSCGFGGASVAATPTPFKPNPGTPSETPLAGSWAVEFRDDGFAPKRLDIEAGQQVRFVNASEKSLWPASSIHPTHQIFPEFDSGAPVDADGVWAFTFDKPGFWRYHNHMAPEHSGLIVVEGGESEQRPAPIALGR